MAFARPRFWPLFCFLVCFGTTMALGTWQIERLHWKEDLIATIEAARAKPPMIQLPRTEAELAAKNFYPVHVRGSWLGGTEFHLAARYFQGTFGYWIITPMRLADGRILLVNRGWVPAEKKDPAKRPDTKVGGDANIHGLLRTGAERSYFTPKNLPEKNLWFGRDIAEMAAYAHLTDVVPAMVDAIGTQDANHLPIPSDGVIRLRNAHLSYIITWYGIALGILVIFLVYHWNLKPRS